MTQSQDLAIAKALFETIHESKDGAPSGILYSAVMAHGITLSHYERLMAVLIDAKLVRVSNHVYYSLR